MKPMEHWWVGALWLLALGLVMGTAPTPVWAASPSAAPASTSPGDAPAATVQVTGDVVNLRAGPGLEHEVQGQVQQGDELQVTGISADGHWLLIEQEGARRWIFADLTNVAVAARQTLVVVLPFTAEVAGIEPSRTFDGDYDNLEAHQGGAYLLEQRGPTIGAVFTTTSSPVQYFARQAPEILFTLPPEFRPALDIDWDVEGWPVTPEGGSAADRAGPTVFKLRVAADGTVRYLDGKSLDAVGHLRYTTRLAWPHAAASPKVCDRSQDVHDVIVAKLGRFCPDISWADLATIQTLGTYPFATHQGVLVVNHPHDLAGLQNVRTALFHTWGVFPEAMLAPMPKLRSLAVRAGSVHLDHPPPHRGDYDLPADLLAYTPLLTHLELEVTTVEKLPLGFLAQVPRLESLRIVDRFPPYAQAFYWPWRNSQEMARFLQGAPNLAELELELVNIGELPSGFLVPVPNLKKLTLHAEHVRTWPEKFPVGVPHLRQLTVHAPYLRVLPETFLTDVPRLESLELDFGHMRYLPASFLAETPHLNQVRLDLSLKDPLEWLLLYEQLAQLNEDWLFDPAIRVHSHTQVSVGHRQICAISDSRLTCWPGTGRPYTLHNRFRSVSAGDGHTCGLTLDHRIECWDHNGVRHLEAPVGVFQSVAVGRAHACGVQENAAVVCWGDNGYGQATAPSGDFQAVTAGISHSCGLRSDGTVACWGDNRKGQSDAPTGQFGKISAGGQFSCAVDADQIQLRCWGDNSAGQTDLSEIGKIGKRIRSLDAGFDHACASFANLGVRCWGSNEFGQREAPLGDFSGISAGYKASCVLADGYRRCWGLPVHQQVQAAGETGTGPRSLAATGVPLATYRVGEDTSATGLSPSACPDQGPSPSLACDRELLLEIQEGLGLWDHPGPAARRLWPAHSPVQDFDGVTLSGDPPRVTELRLNAGTYVVNDGVLPAALGRLTHLQHLNLAGKQLTGPLPPELGQLANLRFLSLSGNQLTGPLPPELGQLDNLERLSLSRNQLTGSLPLELGRLARLRLLNLDGNQLTGPLPPELGQLANLRFLNLVGNQLTGPLPPELGQLDNLERLSLSRNQLTGSLPLELGRLARLRLLDLDGNQLTGPLPPELGQLDSLERLDLSHNQLTGGIPPELAQLSDLLQLTLPHNRLTGSISPDLGQLSSLQRLDLSHNQLTGSLPPELGQLSQLEELNVEHNQLAGSIQPALGDFPRLHHLNLAHNRLDSAVLRDLAQLTGLSVLDLSSNQLTGPLPPEWVQPRLLTALRLADNRLTGSLPPGLGELIWLRELDLAGNPIAGCLPPEVHAKCDTCADLPVCPAPSASVCPDQGPSPSLACDKEILLALRDRFWGPDVWQPDASLEEEFWGSTWGETYLGITVGGDPPRVTALRLEPGEYFYAHPHFSGPIPSALGRLPWLQELTLRGSPNHERYQLTGAIPPELGQLTLLQHLTVEGNNLAGPLPSELGQLTQLQSLSLPDNLLTGPIPSELGQLAALEVLAVQGNQLTGPIPSELGQLAALKGLVLSANQLSESIPPELGQLGQLTRLDLSANQLTDPIPPELGQLDQLKHLDLSANQLTDPIPSELGQLDQLKHLDLSANQLTDPIPPELGQLDRLELLDLSINQLNGPIPPELGLLAPLQTLNLSANQLTGFMPFKLAVFSSLDTLDLRDNPITGCLDPAWRLRIRDIYTDLGEAAYCED